MLGVIKYNERHFLLMIWLFLTLVNLNKAFHIDDTFHLEAAVQITQDPLHPMSGSINWNDTPHKISIYNQPPLFFFLIAGVGNLLGYTEFPLHLLLSVFSFLALYYFQKITKIIGAQQPNVLLALFALCPAFVVNQNLMVDIPLLACLLGASYFLLKGLEHQSLKSYIWSMLWFSVGVLIKYSILPFVPIFALALLLNKQFKGLVYMFLPLLTLGVWSWWNYMEYGAIHFLDRPVHQFDFDQFLNFIACLGAISPFFISLICGVFLSKLVRYLLLTACLLFLFCIIFALLGWVSLEVINGSLNTIFLGVGFSILGIILFHATSSIMNEKWEYRKTKEFIVFMLMMAFSVFMIISPQFMASRHLLLVIPFILLFAHSLISKAENMVNWFSISVAFLLTLSMGVSDWLYANYYRKTAMETAELIEGRIWSLGHWGWQWYSQKEGMKFYDSKKEISVGLGDYLVFPVKVPKQPISEGIQYEVIKKHFHESSLGSFISGTNASFYNSSVNKPLWSLSKLPIDTIYICRVIDDISIDEIKLMMQGDEVWLTSMKQKAIDRRVPLDSMLYIDAKWLKYSALKE